jgi:hypothetical protein
MEYEIVEKIDDLRFDDKYEQITKGLTSDEFPKYLLFIDTFFSEFIPILRIFERSDNTPIFGSIHLNNLYKIFIGKLAKDIH